MEQKKKNRRKFKMVTLKRTKRKKKQQQRLKVNLPKVVTTQDHAHDVLADIMNVSFYCSQNYGALIGILQTEEWIRLSRDF